MDSAFSSFAGSLVELASDGLLIIDSADTIRQINREACRLLCGDEKLEAAGRNIYELIPIPAIKRLMQTCIGKLGQQQKLAETYSVEIEETGQFKWFHIRAGNFAGPDGFRGLIISDVTETYFPGHILGTLMSSFPGGVLVFDRMMRITLASESIAKYCGYDSWRDLTGLRVDQLSIDVQPVEKMLAKAILTGEPAREVVHVHNPETGVRWYYEYLRCIQSDSGIFAYLLTIMDITREIKPQAILESLMDSSSDLMAIIDPGGNLEFVSQTMASMFGHGDWRNLVGQPAETVFRREKKTARFSRENMLERIDTTYRDTICIKQNGRDSVLNYQIDNLNYHDENFGTVIMASNITDLVEAREHAESAVREKSAFLANMTHELRTPLNAVLGMNELISFTELSPLQRKYVTHIRSSANHLMSIITDILDFSRIEANRIELSPAEYNLTDLIQDVINFIVVAATEKELYVTADICPSIPVFLIGDSIRLKQILINLLNNAVKFTPTGGVSLSVSCKNNSRGSGGITLIFRIQDTGIGIPEEKQANLFRRFMRIEKENASPVEGTGLGLSISQGLAQLMDGTISLESSAGSGSVFTADVKQQAVPGSPPLADFSFVKNSEPLSLLVFDRCEPVLQSIFSMAEYAGISAEICSDGNIFREKLAAAPFKWTHVIFEYSTGYEIAREFAQTYKKVRWLGMLLDSDLFEKENRSGIDFLFKPLLVSTFAQFMRGEHVDFNITDKDTPGTPQVLPVYFRAKDTRILVVDDNILNRKLAEEFLQILNIHTDEAINGRDALEKIRKNRYDLILMDHIMPEMDGVQAVRHIKSQPEYAKIPVIMLTANAGGESRNEFLDAGVQDVLAKPLVFETFSACLKKWLPAEKKVYTHDDPGAGNEKNASAKPEWIYGLDRAKGIECTGSLENLKKMLEIFNQTSEGMLEKLETAKVSGNKNDFRIAAHSLIGTAGCIGARDLPEDARELEQAILNNQTETVEKIYPRVHDNLRKIVDAVAQYCQTI
ncbi:response regulator [Brucepastera parasyntrophica]|uniref:ATP-binding protein n=1 Tax=Brucepastera parasyntrophica TaxID=2880008 RepID=UPI00210D56D9|nr:ATP-binding protein [Brucepastera parasyntrophica]ULQ58829.1 response regulator [Brucepastera parasyntrophica]